jgi:hypothetical protein
VVLPAGNIRIDNTISITGSSVELVGHGTNLRYYGTAGTAAVDGNADYARSCVLRGFTIEVMSDGAISGVRCRFSHCQFFQIGVTLRGSDNIGWLMEGDVDGSGPYYDTFYDCRVQGDATFVKTGQYGWKFTSAETAPGSGVFTRGPNACGWFGGRTGQVQHGWLIRGHGNVVVNHVLEACGWGGNTIVDFACDEANQTVGNIFAPRYIEGSSTAANVFRMATLASANEVIQAYRTSTGSAVLWTDPSGENHLKSSQQTRIPVEDYALVTDDGDYPKIIGDTLPGVQLETSAGHVAYVRAFPSNSQASRFYDFSVTPSGGSLQTLLRFGTTEMHMAASTVRLNNNSVPVYLSITGNSNPEGSNTAPAGSILLGTSGRAWLKTTGSGNTGWGHIRPSAVGSDVASATTIAPTAPVQFVTGATAIATITPPDADTSWEMVFIPTAAWTTNTSGNIANAITAVPNVPVYAVWVPSTSKWYLK